MKNIFIFLCISFFISLHLNAQYNKIPKKWKSWIDSTIHVTINYPPKWELQKKGEPAIRFFLKSPLERKSELFRQNIFLHFKINNSENLRVEDFISEKTINIYKQKFKSFRVINKEKIEIDGLETSHIEYTFEQPIDGRMYKIGAIERQIIFLKGIYKFTYTFLADEDDNFRDDILNIFNYLKFGRAVIY